MAELPPIKKPPKLSSKGLGSIFAPKKSRWKWIFDNPTNCAATFGGLGFLFGVNPFIALSFLIIWSLIAVTTKYSSLSSLIAILVAPLYFIINYNLYFGFFFIYLTLVIITKHSENIKRLLNKTESKIKLTK